jgi:hypothetical protein
MAEAQAVEQPRQAGNVVTSENLTEWTMDRLGLATEETPTEAEAVEETPDSEPVAEEGESEHDLEAEGKATEERKQNPKLEKRFSELTKARKLAEENAAKAQAEKEQLEARLREYEDRQAPQQQQVDESPIGREPRPDQFDDAFEYAKALAEWSAEKALYDRDQQEANRKIEEQRQKVLKTWSEKLEKAKPNLADFDEVIESTQVVVSNEVRDAIIESDVGPEILYHLASLDGEEAEKFQALPVSKALREIGKLEARFEKQEAAEETAVRSKPVVQKSKAPAPLSPLKATGSAMDSSIGSDGEFHGSFQAWKAARKAGKIR